jgi:hypothetical protein
MTGLTHPLEIEIQANPADPFESVKYLVPYVSGIEIRNQERGTSSRALNSCKMIVIINCCKTIVTNLFC